MGCPQSRERSLLDLVGHKRGQVAGGTAGGGGDGGGEKEGEGPGMIESPAGLAVELWSQGWSWPWLGKGGAAMAGDCAGHPPRTSRDPGTHPCCAREGEAAGLGWAVEDGVWWRTWLQLPTRLCLRAGCLPALLSSQGHLVSPHWVREWPPLDGAGTLGSNSDGWVSLGKSLVLNDLHLENKTSTS